MLITTLFLTIIYSNRRWVAGRACRAGTKGQRGCNTMTRHIDYRNTLYEYCTRDGPSHHSRSNVKQIQRGKNLINTTLENWSAVTHPITLVHCSPGPPSTTGMTLYIKIPLRLKRPKIKKGPDREGGAQESNSRSGDIEYGKRVLEGTSVL